jgi:hypothetical protein
MAKPATCSPRLRFCNLLGVFLAGPDAETAIDGMHRVVITIRERAAVLREIEAKAE